MSELYLPPDYFSVVQPFLHALSGEEWSITYGLRYALIGETEQDICDNVFAATKASLAALLDNNLAFQKTVMYYRNSEGGPLQQVVAAGAVANGTDTNAKAPPNVCVSIKKKTNFVGRRYRGRMFLPGVVDESIVDEVGVITTASLASINTVVADWYNDVLAVQDVTEWALLHAPWVNEPEDDTPTPTEITSLECAPVVVTQRRRLP